MTRPIPFWSYDSSVRASYELPLRMEEHVVYEEVKEAHRVAGLKLRSGHQLHYSVERKRIIARRYLVARHEVCCSTFPVFCWQTYASPRAAEKSPV